MSLLSISRRLSEEVGAMRFAPPVTHVYNPLDYAWGPYERFVQRYGSAPKQVVFLGMNPGPFGMAQTGVPFGDVYMARDWLEVSGTVGKPEREHPKRPVLGFELERSEVSGTRLWGWARDRFGTPERFFERFYVVNYCPLCFMEESGRNRVPEKLPKAEREPLFASCDRALRASVEHLEPEWVVGVGAFARKCAERVLGDMDLRIGQILHPSPASPAANRGWVEQAERQLGELGIEL